MTVDIAKDEREVKILPPSSSLEKSSSNPENSQNYCAEDTTSGNSKGSPAEVENGVNDPSKEIEVFKQIESNEDMLTSQDKHKNTKVRKVECNKNDI